MKNFTNVKKIAAALMMTQVLVACGTSDDLSAVTTSSIKVNSNSSAEELALAGEQLVSFHSFHLADRVLDQALKADGKNARALFYKDLLRPFTKFDGILTRIQGQYRADANIDAELENAPTVPLKDFLTKAGKKKISNAKEGQDFLVEVRDALIQSSRGFKKRMGTELELHLNPTTFVELVQDRKNETCVEHKIEVEGATSYEYICNAAKQRDLYVYRVNTPDMLFMHQYYGGLALMLMPYTAYNAQGFEQVQEQLQGAENLNTVELRAVLFAQKNFLTLRKDHNLSFFKEMGSSLVSAAKWAQKYQDRLCNYTDTFEKAHVKALCLTQEASQSLEGSIAVLQAVLGGPMKQTFEHEDGAKEVTVNYSVLWEKPIRDLKATFLPMNIDQCGNSIFTDKTLGGLLPDGNVQEFNVGCAHE